MFSPQTKKKWNICILKYLFGLLEIFVKLVKYHNVMSFAGCSSKF